MKKLLLLFMVFFFLGVFTVSAVDSPDQEKQLMVFVSDVGLVTLPAVAKATLAEDTIIETIKQEALYTDLPIYRKIVYETTMYNGQLQKSREAVTVGDHIPITA